MLFMLNPFQKKNGSERTGKYRRAENKAAVSKAILKSFIDAKIYHSFA